MSSFLDLPVVPFGAARFGSDGTTDHVVIEEPLEIRINSRNIAITMRTPGHDEELATGFLFTEGLIRGADQILSVTAAGNQVNVQMQDCPAVAPRLTMTSACGVCGKESIDHLYAAGCKPCPSDSFSIRAAVLQGLPETLRFAQATFEQTGGLHAAGLFNSECELKIIREDVGRHNAVDKVIGGLLRSGLKPHLHLLLVSGRASFELVQKAAMAGIPMLAAVGAPSTLAVETAKRFNMTLAGFLRDDRFNIYTGAERILC